jgi:beta-lactamase regulating signal transducer with metallopeptidase domain
MLSWQLCDWILHSAPPTFRYRAANLHLIALATAPALTALVSHGALAAGISGGTGGSFSGASPAFLLLPAFHLVVSILPAIAAVWAFGIFAGAWLIFGGWVRAFRINSATRMQGGVLEMVNDLARGLGLVRVPSVFQADVASPFVVGVRPERLVLPRTIEQQLTPDELRALLAHELAHIKRSDCLSNLLQMAIVLLLWPHPAAWFLWLRLRQEREVCCDDMAVRFCGSAATLARALYRLAAATPPAHFGVLSATAGPLERRFERMLQRQLPALPLVARTIPVLALVALPFATISLARSIQVDEAAQRAFVASAWAPSVSIHAHDPAGFFRVELRRGRVLGISISDEPIPREYVIQQGDHVRVLGRGGQELLALQVDPRGGIRWQARGRQPQPSF